ncbi:DUF4238 domain-containing protein [Stenotrophomonas maltophilia]|uniref:DUF4238 domain-containing protein n=1 Tax=Stenotrophomonas maltophilia TaxID=40324 RepID=UPI0034DB2BC1
MSNHKYNHYVHCAYLRSWEVSKQVRSYDLHRNQVITSSAKNTGGENYFYSFHPDPVVIQLVMYTFSDIVKQDGAGAVYARYLEELSSTAEAEPMQRNKRFIEGQYERWETATGEALKEIRESCRGPLSAKTLESLVKLYCMQHLRTPLMRRRVMDRIRGLTYDGVALSETQSEDYFKIRLVADAQAMASDIIAEGFQITLYDTGDERLINSDNPAVQWVHPLKSVRDIRGFMPLTPTLAMGIDHIGQGAASLRTEVVGAAKVRQWNANIIHGAHAFLYFSTPEQIEQYADAVNERLAVIAG